MDDSSNWLWTDRRGFSHRWARTTGGDLMSGQAVPVSISALINPINGESVPCPPGTQIMADDLDWMVHGWEAVFLIEWKIRQAEWAVKNHGPDSPASGRCR